MIYFNIFIYMHMHIPYNRCYRDKMGGRDGEREEKRAKETWRGFVILVLFAFLVVMETKSQIRNPKQLSQTPEGKSGQMGSR